MKTQKEINLPGTTKSIGIAADHGGFELKEFLTGKLREAGYEVTDFGDRQLKADDDYPDFVIPLARAIAAGTVDRGVGICGSGVGVSIAANKVAGVRACLIEENFSAHQGVEDDDLNMICFGGLLVGHALAFGNWCKHFSPRDSLARSGFVADWQKWPNSKTNNAWRIIRERTNTRHQTKLL